MYNEEHRHVMAAVRKDVDPIWHGLAKQAALNGCRKTTCYGGNYCGAECVNFLYPTTCERGYFNVLKWIAANDNARFSTIKAKFGMYPQITLQRLLDGGLATKDEDHRYVATKLGREYLKYGEKYLVPRNMH